MFYGNITNRRNQFTYDKIYASKTELIQNNTDDTVEILSEKFSINKNDGVMIGRYVLIDYNYNEKDGYNYNDNYSQDNNGIAAVGNKRSWDSTVWQKIAETIDGETNTYYILIADLSLSDTRKQVEDFLYGKDRSILIDVDDAENAKNWKLGYLYRTPDGKIYTLNNQGEPEIVFNLDAIPPEQGFNSLYDLALQMRTFAEESSITELQLGWILSPFTSKVDIDFETGGDIMNLIYNTANEYSVVNVTNAEGQIKQYNSHNLLINTHKFDITKYLSLLATITFAQDYREGDIVSISMITSNSPDEDLYSDKKLQIEDNTRYKVYFMNGYPAEAGAWKKGMSGTFLIPLGDDNIVDEDGFRKIFLNGIAPVFSS